MRRSRINPGCIVYALIALVLLSSNSRADSTDGTSVWMVGNQDKAYLDVSGISADTGNPFGVTSWPIVINSRGGTYDPMFKQWFWYRVGSTGQQASLSTLPVVASYSLDYTSATTTYTGPGFIATVTFNVPDKPVPAYSSTFIKTMNIQNTTGEELDYHLFSYSDMDVSTTTDAVQIIDGSRAVQTDLLGKTLVQTSTLKPSHYDLDFGGATLMDSLQNGLLPLEMSDTSGPFDEMGDMQFGFQYDLKIPVNGSVSLSITDKIFPTEPLVVTNSLVGGSCAGNGVNATYQVCVSNPNAIAVNNVVVTSEVKPGESDAGGSISFVSATDDGTYDAATKSVRWSIPTLAALAPSQCFQTTVLANVSQDVTAIATSYGDETYPAQLAVTTPLCNYPPMVTSAPTSAFTGVAFTYQIAATDRESDPLSLTLVQAPPGMTMDGGNTLHWVPSYEQRNLSHPVAIDVSDGNSVTHYKFQIYVQFQNQPPTAPSQQTASLTLSQAGSFQLAATDPEGSVLTFKTVDALPSGLTLSSSGLLSGIPTTAGTYLINIAITDTAAGAATSRLTVTVGSAAVQAPAMAPIASLTANAGTAFNHQIAASDPQGQPLHFTLSGSPVGMSVSSSGLISWAKAVTGSYAITATASNASSLSASRSFTLSVTNAAPVVANPGDRSNARGALVSLQVAAIDADADALNYSATGLPLGLSIDSSTGMISGTVSAAALTNNATVTVTDGTAQVSVSFTWKVSSTRLAPVLNNPGPQSSPRGAFVRLAINATDGNGDLLSYSAIRLPRGLSINRRTGMISGIISILERGNNRVKVAVSDGTVSVSVSFVWTVSKANQALAVTNPGPQSGSQGAVISPGNIAPVLTNPGAQSSTRGAVLKLTINATDGNDDLLSYSATGLPKGLSINRSTGVISGTISSYASGNSRVKVTVSDGSFSVSANFVWSVSVKTGRKPSRVSSIALPDRGKRSWR